jgi:hypothetical protein
MVIKPKLKPTFSSPYTQVVTAASNTSFIDACTKERRAFTIGLTATRANFVTNQNYFSAVQKKIFVLNLTSTPYFMFGKFNSINEAKNNFYDLH